VVELRKAVQDEAGLLEGLVEEVDTGKQSLFRSEAELIRFVRDRFAESCLNSPEKNGQNERWNYHL
jgi:hypothetical protein